MATKFIHLQTLLQRKQGLLSSFLTSATRRRRCSRRSRQVQGDAAKRSRACRLCLPGWHSGRRATMAWCCWVSRCSATIPRSHSGKMQPSHHALHWKTNIAQASGYLYHRRIPVVFALMDLLHRCGAAAEYQRPDCDAIIRVEHGERIMQIATRCTTKHSFVICFLP